MHDLAMLLLAGLVMVGFIALVMWWGLGDE